METSVCISFQDILKYPFSTSLKHPKALFIQEMLTKYQCFQEKIDTRFGGPKWNPAPKKYNKQESGSVAKERTKIGNKDTSKEALLIKDFQSLLNKLTNKNYNSIVIQVKRIFDANYLSLFTNILWTYLQKQPEYQGLYIQILENIYPMLQDDMIIEMGRSWNLLWNGYVSSKQWMLSKELVEQSHNYQDFCEYVKEKKRLMAVAQAWARLMNLGIVQADAYDLLYDILNCVHNDLNITNVIDTMCLECYVEQCRVYYDNLSIKLKEQLPNSIENSICDLRELDVKKSCQFKIEDFVSLIIKNEEKKKYIYDVEDEL